MTGIGHNSELQSIVDRIERLEEERRGLSSDIRSVFDESKGKGFDIPAIREILKLRRMDAKKREELSAIVETYKIQLKMDL